MNEEKQTLFEDVKEKNELARSARVATMNGTCSIGKSYSGEVEEYTASVNTKKWISREKYKALPNSLKKVYLEAIMTTFGVKAKNIYAKWGWNANKASRDCRQLGVKLQKGGRISELKMNAFNNFVNGVTEAPAYVAPVAEPTNRGKNVAIDEGCEVPHLAKIKITKEMLDTMKPYSLGEFIASLVETRGGVDIVYREEVE